MRLKELSNLKWYMSIAFRSWMFCDYSSISLYFSCLVNLQVLLLSHRPSLVNLQLPELDPPLGVVDSKNFSHNVWSWPEYTPENYADIVYAFLAVRPPALYMESVARVITHDCHARAANFLRRWQTFPCSYYHISSEKISFLWNYYVMLFLMHHIFRTFYYWLLPT